MYIAAVTKSRMPPDSKESRATTGSIATFKMVSQAAQHKCEHSSASVWTELQHDLNAGVYSMAYRKCAVDNEEEAKDEETSAATAILLQLGQPIANGGLIVVIDIRICNQAKEQYTNKYKYACPAYEAYVTCMPPPTVAYLA